MQRRAPVVVALVDADDGARRVVQQRAHHVDLAVGGRVEQFEEHALLALLEQLRQLFCGGVGRRAARTHLRSSTEKWRGCFSVSKRRREGAEGGERVKGRRPPRTCSSTLFWILPASPTNSAATALYSARERARHVVRCMAVSVACCRTPKMKATSHSAEPGLEISIAAGEEPVSPSQPTVLLRDPAALLAPSARLPASPGFAAASFAFVAAAAAPAAGTAGTGSAVLLCELRRRSDGETYLTKLPECTEEPTSPSASSTAMTRTLQPLAPPA